MSARRKGDNSSTETVSRHVYASSCPQFHVEARVECRPSPTWTPPRSGSLPGRRVARSLVGRSDAGETRSTPAIDASKARTNAFDMLSCRHATSSSNSSNSTSSNSNSNSSNSNSNSSSLPCRALANESSVQKILFRQSDRRRPIVSDRMYVPCDNPTKQMQQMQRLDCQLCAEHFKSAINVTRCAYQ